MPIGFDDTTNETQEYKDFIEKFKPKKTTDDCYTPPNIYEVVRNWAMNEHGLEGRPVIRPFFPGGDYEAEEYPEDCVVIDNPPFSILSQICRFYDKRGIDYFMFAPSLTLFSTNSGKSNYVVSGSGITYENGATVATGFVTNLGTNRIVLSPTLAHQLAEANRENTKPATELPKYTYPDNVVTSALLHKFIKKGVELRIPREEAAFVRALDHQREKGKAIFGGGFLLSERKTAEKVAIEGEVAEKTAAEKWRLSAREREIIAGLRPEMNNDWMR